MSTWPAGEHLVEVYDALYASLAEAASRATNDSFVLRLHEASRGFGQLALELRDDEEVSADSLVRSLVSGSLSADETGALTLYALAVVIGPRLLVSLRDYFDDETDEARRTLLMHGSDLVVSEILAMGRALSGGETSDDPAWAKAARDLADALDAASMAESLGQRT